MEKEKEVEIKNNKENYKLSKKKKRFWWLLFIINALFLISPFSAVLYGYYPISLLIIMVYYIFIIVIYNKKNQMTAYTLIKISAIVWILLNIYFAYKFITAPIYCGAGC